jgi:hypothetical protein
LDLSHEQGSGELEEGGGGMLDAERRKRQWLFFSALFLFTQMRKNPERRERESEEREKTPEQSGGKGEKGTRGRP